MPKRRQTVAPRNNLEVLAERISKLEKTITPLQQAGTTTIQTVDTEAYPDPVQGEILVNWPGVHVPATPADPVQYYHNDPNDPGFKKFGEGEKTHWLFASTQPIGWETDGTHEVVDFYNVWISDGGEAYFDYEINVGAGQFGDDTVTVGLTPEADGVFTFTVDFITSDIPTDDAPLWFRGLVMPGASGGASAPPYPGIIGFPPSGGNLLALEQFYVSLIGGDDFWIPRSWTIPVKNISASVMAEIWVAMGYEPGVDEFWTVRLWVVRHGSDNWSAPNYSWDHATWQTP